MAPGRDGVDPGGQVDGRGRQPRASVGEPFGEQLAVTYRVVDEEPVKAGIDPYNKLIDRVPGDNVQDAPAPGG